MRNILAHVPQKEKDAFAAQLKEIWLMPSVELARQRAKQLSERYGKRFPRAIEVLEEGLEDSLAFYAFPELDARKISSNNMLERLNKKIRRRTNVVGIFPSTDSYLRLVTTISYGVCRGLVCLPSVSQSQIHSDTAASRSLIHCTQSHNCELPLTQPMISVCPLFSIDYFLHFSIDFLQCDGIFWSMN
jgi:hypothetical protein